MHRHCNHIIQNNFNLNYSAYLKQNSYRIGSIQKQTGNHPSMIILLNHKYLLIAMRVFISRIQRKFSQFKPKQIIESYWQVQKKVEQLHQLFTKSKYPIIFTGAGISTSLGIPDYRSGTQTIIKTGPGLWNRNLHQPNPHQIPIDKLVDIANPSLSHMFISTLIRKGIVKHLISQNTDGLHLKSGVPIQNISELHGNRNLQYCVKCLRKYSRDFRTLKRDGKKYHPGEKRDHNTGRSCENCGGDLHDSIIYFGEKLPREQLESAIYHASRADFCLCIGSSLTVKPSANFPLYVTQKPQGNICIVNIQQTPLDNVAALRINYFCDDVMELLSNKLAINIDKLIVRHFLRIVIQRSNQQIVVKLEGKDKNGNNLSFIRCIHLNYFDNSSKQQIQVVGHRCVLKIANQKLQLLRSLTLFHFAQKPPLQLEIEDFKPLQNSDFYLAYQLEDNIWKSLNDNV